MKINGTIFSKPQQDQLKRGIGGVVEGSTPSTMGFVSGAVVPSSGNINFKIYSGNTATDGTLAYTTEQLSLTDVVFLK